MHQPQVDVCDLKSPEAHLQALEGWFVAVVLAPVLCGNENIFTLELPLGYLVRQTAAITACVMMTLLSTARVQLRKKGEKAREWPGVTLTHAPTARSVFWLL